MAEADQKRKALAQLLPPQAGPQLKPPEVKPPVLQMTIARVEAQPRAQLATLFSGFYTSCLTKAENEGTAAAFNNTEMHRFFGPKVAQA